MAGETKVRVDLGEGTIVRVQARNHVWNADEPVFQRGTDEGPNPYELLLGALGACTALTLRLYAHHKKIALKAIRLDYSFTREYGRDCRECETDDDAKLDVIRARVVLQGAMDEGQKTRLTEIVSRCPVHRTLEGGPKMFETVEFVD
jgi:putative redox protein